MTKIWISKRYLFVKRKDQFISWNCHENMEALLLIKYQSLIAVECSQATCHISLLECFPNSQIYNGCKSEIFYVILFLQHSSPVNAGATNSKLCRYLLQYGLKNIKISGFASLTLQTFASFNFAYEQRTLVNYSHSYPYIH